MMKDYTMSQYATREDLYADMLKDIKELIRQRDENEKKWLESAKGVASLKARHDKLEVENIDLRAKVEELESALSDISSPALLLSDRLRDKHYRECEEIAMGERVNAEETQADDDRAYNQACMDIALMIARAREGK